jgi:O-acetyl-ADP-ribose deacetylase (regulator of RNase III)
MNALQKIEVIKGDITTLKVDAVVNAANTSLLGGGGVDGAIHRAAGNELYQECLALNGCGIGEAKMTGGYRLPAKHVIHTVGPIWQGGSAGEEQLLASSYENCVRIVATNDLKTIAFPSISTGVYGYPIDKACVIAFDSVLQAIETYPAIEQVIFCTFSDSDFFIYQREFARRKALANQD